MKRSKIVAIISVAVVLVGMVASVYLYIYFSEPVQTIKGLSLPDGCETVHPIRVCYSDVYYDKILGEKVILSSMTYDETVRYIEKNNSEEQLENISFVRYGGMSDDYIYDSEDDIFVAPEQYDYYVKIEYVKEL